MAPGSNSLLSAATAHPDGLHGRVRGEEVVLPWDELRRIAVRTTTGGPFLDDVFFFLTYANDESFAVPQSDAGIEILTRLQEFPGFDNEAVIRAMGSTTNAEFVCWEATA